MCVYVYYIGWYIAPAQQFSGYKFSKEGDTYSNRILNCCLMVQV